MNGVVHQIYPRSFTDATGAGIGDLAGVTARLGYAAGLGAQAIWLTPFQRAPQADHGYDVSVYTDVDPPFGDIAAFDALAARAHELGLRVIVDVAPNHCPVEHPPFRAKLAAAPGSPRPQPHPLRRRPQRPRPGPARVGCDRLRPADPPAGDQGGGEPRRPPRPDPLRQHGPGPRRTARRAGTAGRDVPASGARSWVRQDPAWARSGTSRDGCRVPLPWHTDPAGTYGFSPAGAVPPWLPGALSAEAQENDPGSTLHLTRRALELRRSLPANDTVRW